MSPKSPKKTSSSNIKSKSPPGKTKITSSQSSSASVPQRANAFKASRIPIYGFALSLFVRLVLLPLNNKFNVVGLYRWNYPTPYIANNGTCKVLHADKMHFCEHATIWNEYGIGLASCDPGRAEWNTVLGILKNPDSRGQIFIFNYTNDKTKVLQLEGFPKSSDFHPLGMDMFSEPNSDKATLFIINHQRSGPTIEVFDLFSLGSDISSIKIIYRTTVKAQEGIKSANSVTAISHTSAYITNDHTWTLLEDGSPWPIIETFTGIVKGWVSHLELLQNNNAIVRKVYEGIPFANGIGKSHDGHTLYVSSSSTGFIYILDIQEDGSLNRTGSMRFGYALDNIHVTQRFNSTGNYEDIVVVGGHPNFFKLTSVSHDLHNPHLISPSWISMASPKSKSKTDSKLTDTGSFHHEPPVNPRWELKTLYEDDGRNFRTTSGGSLDIDRNILLSSGLYEHGLLVCKNILQTST